MNDSVEQFLNDLAIQKRASPHTIAAYRRDLARLTALAADVAPATLRTPQLRRGLMQLHAQELAPRSIARTLSAWRSYYAWLARRGAIALNPADGLRAPKRPRSLPKALGIDQAAALLDAPVARPATGPANDPLRIRDAAMFELLYSSGLRLSELVSLDWPGGLDLGGGEVTVTGYVRADGSGDSTAVTDRSTRAVSSERIGEALGLEVYGGFVELRSETPEPATALEPVELPELAQESLVVFDAEVINGAATDARQHRGA